MTYSKEYTTDENHIDVQNIMDGLYYPFYMEDCRHSFAKEVLDFDLEENARNGTNIVLSEYTLKFLRPLKKDDRFTVTCLVIADSEGKPKIYFKQTIIKDGKAMTEAVFTATCVLSSGGRPFIPEGLKEKVAQLATAE